MHSMITKWTINVPRKNKSLNLQEQRNPWQESSNSSSLKNIDYNNPYPHTPTD